jgi:Icc protein
MLAAAGLLAIASIANAQLFGTVYHDRNRNGERESSEVGIAGVAVSNQDTVVVSDAYGRFTLPSGRGHGVVFVSVPSGHRPVGRFWRRVDESLTFGLARDQEPQSGSLTFIHASDTHIAEQSAPRMRALRRMVDSIRPDFLLITGDLVRDALRVPEAESRGYYDLFKRERDAFVTPVHTVPGNHEIFGIESDKSGVSPAHPLFGKGLYRSYFGPDYYSFNRGGVHFVALNTADITDKSYFGHVDSLQLAWLKRDLDAIPPGTRVVTFNHIPLYSAAEIVNGFDDGPPAPTLITVGGKTRFRHAVSNTDSVLAVTRRRNHSLALGGHIHVVERLEYEWEGQRVHFETSAATVAPVRSAGQTFPSGFTIWTLRPGRPDSSRFVRLDP